MNINRDNYEKFFLDFAEGSLTAEEERDLQEFLRVHPDLEEELRDIHAVKLSPGDVRFPDRDDINFAPVAYVEGDLSPEERVLFEAEMEENQALQKEVDIYRRVKLSPGAVEYADKAFLKKPVTGIRYLNWRVLVPLAAAAAAAVLIYIGIGDARFVEEMATADDPVGERLQEVSESQPASPIVQNRQEQSGTASDSNDTASDNNTSAEDRQNVNQGRRALPGQPVIRVIRNSNTAMPVSTMNQAPSADAIGKGDSEQKRIAAVSLDRSRVPSVKVPEQRLAGIQTPLPSISPRSLNVTQLARLQVSRINEIAEQDEQLLVSLASAGISEINKRAGTNMKLLASTSEEGRVNGIEFRSRLFSLRAPIQASEN